MIVVLKDQEKREQIDLLVEWLGKQGVSVQATEGAHRTILGLIGDTSHIDIDLLRALEIVEDVKRVQEPYKKANRKFHPKDTVVRIGDVEIGGDSFAVIAGPCSVESEAQLLAVAEAVKGAGAGLLRGGAFKPRTSPYAFQGLRAEGIRMLLEAKRRTGLPIVTELMDPSQIPLFEEVDVIQIGARNMQNFELLKEVGALRKPILLKRGLSSTLQEFVMSAEYIMAGGNEQVILCERGIRTFETATRNTLDLSAIPALRQMTHLPIIVDPSHATGYARFVAPMALAAVAAGANGLMIEVHNDPSAALCDGPQALPPDAFSDLMKRVNAVRSALL